VVVIKPLALSSAIEGIREKKPKDTKLKLKNPLVYIYN